MLYAYHSNDTLCLLYYKLLIHIFKSSSIIHNYDVNYTTDVPTSPVVEAPPKVDDWSLFMDMLI